MTEPTTDPAGDQPADVIHQPTLPTMELPEYHGRQPVGMRTSLTGAGTRVSQAHTIGDLVVLVIEARVRSASHEDTDDGLIYSERLKVLDLFELNPAQGGRLLSTVRTLYRRAEDTAKGRQQMPGMDEVVHTDASGIVLTPAEVEAIQGDPVRAMLAPELTPAVVVYDTGHRDLWPDDYPPDFPRPRLGEEYDTEDGGVCEVVQLLDHRTGEPLDEAPRPDVAGEVSPDHPSNQPPRLIAVPDLPEPEAAGPEPDPEPEAEPDPFAGDLGDGVAGWEDENPPRPLTDSEQTAARLLPTSADFAFVDVQIPELVAKLAEITSLDDLGRIAQAERQGRGRGLRARAGALKAIGRRIAEVESSEAQA